MVSNDSDITKHTVLCAYHDGFFAASSAKTLTCTTPTVARYVSISIKDKHVDGRSLFALCEVVIMGNIPIGKL